jgi:HEAT repeat protein
MRGEARVQGLTQALSDPDPDVRATAVESLTVAWSGGPEFASPATLLLAALGDEDDRVTRAATTRLAALPDPDLPTIWSAIRDGGPRIRTDLLRAIEQVDPARLATLALANAQAPDPAERALAVDLAARAATAESTGIVVEALGDPDPGVRRTAASAMSAIRAPAAVEALARSLSDPQADVRVEAVRALGLIDDDGVPSILIEAMKDPEVMVRQTAADALLRWRSPAVARRLASALAFADLRRPAGEVLEKMGSAAIQPLVEVVTGSDPLAAAVAGGLLARITGPDRFVAELRSTDPAVRLRAVEVVGAIGGRVASEALLGALTDPDVRVRVRSATLLGSLGDLRSVRSLKRTFLSDPVMEVAAAAEAALRALGSHPESDPGDLGPWVGDE